MVFFKVRPRALRQDARSFRKRLAQTRKAKTVRQGVTGMAAIASELAKTETARSGSRSIIRPSGSLRFGLSARFRSSLEQVVISMVTFFICWLGYVTLFLFVGFTRFPPDSVLWLVSEVLMLLCLGILSAIALKSPCRPLTLFSGLLLILLFWASVNV